MKSRIKKIAFWSVGTISLLAIIGAVSPDTSQQNSLESKNSSSNSTKAESDSNQAQSKIETNLVEETEPISPEPVTSSCSGGYINSAGNCVASPSSNPSGATAKCRDGEYSYSQSRSGTCSHHGGVSQWL